MPSHLLAIEFAAVGLGDLGDGENAARYGLGSYVRSYPIGQIAGGGTGAVMKAHRDANGLAADRVIDGERAGFVT